MSNFLELKNGDAINLDLLKRVILPPEKIGAGSCIRVSYIDTISESILFDSRVEAATAYRRILNSNKK